MASKSNNKKLCIIIPMYNEERGAALCIKKVISAIRKLNKPITLIVINDGSKDDTLTILSQMSKKYSKELILVSYIKNKGYGGALKAGIKKGNELNFEYGLFMDSDLTNDPKYIKHFYNASFKNFDCVKASRYIKGGGMQDVPLRRLVMSYLGSYFARTLFRIGIKDVTNGFRMTRLSLLKDVSFKENGFAIILEELYLLKRKKATFAEIPNILTARKDHSSHFTYNPQLLYDYAKYAVKSLSV